MALQVLGIGVLSWITFLPVVGMVLILMIPKEMRTAMKWTAAVVTFLQLVLAAFIFQRFNYSLGGINSADGMQFLERASWIDVKSVAWFGRVHIEYLLGVDGLSVPMVILTALISFVAVFASWNIEKALKGVTTMEEVIRLTRREELEMVIHAATPPDAKAGETKIFAATTAAIAAATPATTATGQG